MAQRDVTTAESIALKLIGIAKSSPFKDMALVRIWVNHLFVAGALPISNGRIEELKFENTVIEKRQNILLHARLNDRAYFREAKTRFGELSEWEKPAIMLGASCLAASEYDTWLAFCKTKATEILSDEYIFWLKKNRTGLIQKLNYDFTIKSRSQRIAALFSNFDFGSLATFGANPADS